MSVNPTIEVQKYGQSLWYDNLSRDMIRSGELQDLIDNYGILGMTSNPTIFEKAIGEGKFYDELLQKTGLTEADLPNRMDRDHWRANKAKLAEVFLTKTRDEWTEIMEGSDICFAPVLDLDEAPLHPHNAKRGTFVDYDGVVQPAPAPRFSRTPGEIQRPPADRGQHTTETLLDWGFSAADVDKLRNERVIGPH